MWTTLVCVFLLTLLPLRLEAARAVEIEDQPLASKAFVRPELSVSLSHVPASELRGTFGADRDDAWSELLKTLGPHAQTYLDPRSGTPSGIITSLPMIPGRGNGNEITLEKLSAMLGRDVRQVDAKLVSDVVTRFVSQFQHALAVETSHLGPARASQVTPELWQFRWPQQVDGIPVRHGHVSATLSHGNLVLLGSEMLGQVRVEIRPTISAESAVEIGFAYLGGRAKTDELWQQPRLEIVPFAPTQYQDGAKFIGPVGKGYDHHLVWAFGLRRAGQIENWEVLVDAHRGVVLAFQDQNHYDEQQVTGGVYPSTSTGVCPTTETCGTMQSDTPMPFAATGLAEPNAFANSAGLFDGTGAPISISLDGRYVRMLDGCGTLSEAGGLDLGGANGEHDCENAGNSPGNTAASRTAFYELNKLIEIARGWIPSNPWLDEPITSNMNILDTCNAFYSPSAGSINFFRSGNGCRNTGELAGVIDHEWGHALDDNDSGGVLSNSSEAYGDIVALYRLRTSCVGYGFFEAIDDGCGLTADGSGFNVNESQNGVECTTDCSGVRDADWDRHVSGEPATALGFVCTECFAGPGPCGAQVHCAAAPSRQAAWDLVARDLQAPPLNLTREDAFNLGSKLFYQGSGNIASWHACTCGEGSNGCGATNGYMQWLAADDDDGDLTNGTPHMTAIFAAFDRHGIACPTPEPVNSGCAGGPTAAPGVTVDTNSNQIDLSWTGVQGASSYRILRSEGHAGCDLGKAVIGEVTGTTFSDTEVANGRTYHYVVKPVGASGACMGPGSECAAGTPLPCAGELVFDRALYDCQDSIGIRLLDSDLAGAGSQVIAVRSTVEMESELVTLTEFPPRSGVFEGTIETASTMPASDGLISVAHGSTVTANYLDASACGLPDVVAERSVSIDCAGQDCFGVLELDRPVYTCSDTIEVSLFDADLAGAEFQEITVASTVEKKPEPFTLVESPPGSGRFSGTVETTDAPVASDGLISAADGSVLIVTYLDASACGLPHIPSELTATSDCVGPEILNVRAEEVTGSSATIRWETSEPATGQVSYGGAPPPETSTALDPSLVTMHSARLTGLPECSPQYFSVSSADGLGQLSLADNAGAFFTFEAGADVHAEYVATDVPKPVPTSSFPTAVMMPIEDTRTIVDVDVRFNMLHPFVGTARIFLRHPDGTLISLSNRHGGTGDHFIDTVFDDEAEVWIGHASAPFTGSFQPDVDLSAFDGKTAEGTWQLWVHDDLPGSDGTITGVELLLTLGQPCEVSARHKSSRRVLERCDGGGPGDGNQYWDDGETAVLRVVLENDGQFDLTGVSATLTPVSPGVAMIDDFATYPDLPVGSSRSSRIPHFAAHLPVGFACGDPVVFDVAIRTDQGTFHDTFEFGTAGQEIPSGTGTVLFEDFSAGIPESWTVQHGGSGGGDINRWTTENPGGRTGNPPISSPFAIVDSLAAGAGASQDERLISPVLDLSDALNATLDFDAYFGFVPGNDARGEVFVKSTFTGGGEMTLLRYEEFSANPDERILDLTLYAAGAPDVQVGFRYEGRFDNWWIVDNVRVTATFPPSCEMVSCEQTTAPGPVVRLWWDDETSASWSLAAGADSYVLYRGAASDLPDLSTPEIDSCVHSTTSDTSLSGISDTPASGGLYWWLVRGVNDFGEGSVGASSAGPRQSEASGVCP